VVQTLGVTAPQTIRWAARHGLAKTVLARHAKRGNLDARLMTEAGLRADPFAAYDEIRARGPISSGPFALTSASHSVCGSVLRSDQFGVELRPQQLPGLARRVLAATRGGALTPVDPPSMLAVDPPTHTRYRRLVSKVFTPRAIEALRPRMELLATELLDDLADGGRTGPVDLVGRYAALLPVTVIAEILGVPAAMRDQFLQWGNGGAVTLDIGIGLREFRQAEADLTALRAWMTEHFRRLRTDPGDDLLSQLVQVQDAEGGLTELELAGTAMLLLGAGFETTVNLIGNGTVQLVRHPDELARLRAHPDMWANAVEEVLRYDSPVQRTARVAMADTEIAGQAVRAGSLVACLLGGANRDPEVFTDPHRFDVGRTNARDHLAFSAGVHFCLGAALARMEGQIGLQALFDRFPDLELAGDPHRRGTRVLRGYDRIPVRLAGARRPVAA
jgi:cytochrome P450